MAEHAPDPIADPIVDIDARLTALVVGAARWRLALGETLERLGRLGGPRALGFSSMAAYAVERCGASGRWVEEARGLARRLAGLPRLRAALGTGAVTWSMAQLLARHATPEDEAELVDTARISTVRALRRRLEPERAAEPDEAPARRTIETVVPVEDAWAFERARMLVEAVTGERSTDTVVEAMLAETLTSLLPPPGDEGGEGGASVLRALDRAADGARFRAEGQAARDAARDALEAAFEGLAAPRLVIDDAPAMPTGAESGDDPVAIDRLIVDIAGRLRARDLEIGRLAREVQDSGGWWALGFVNFDPPRLRRAPRLPPWRARGEFRPFREGTPRHVARGGPGEDVAVPQGRGPARARRGAARRAPRGDAGDADRQGRGRHHGARVGRARRAAHREAPARGRRGGGNARAVARSWPIGPAERAFEAVYRRDRYRCQSPTCDRRDVGAHHVVFRSRGGGDEEDNLVALCGRCHVEGVHAGTITVSGRAPGALRWTIGGVVTVVDRASAAA